MTKDFRSIAATVISQKAFIVYGLACASLYIFAFIRIATDGYGDDTNTPTMLYSWQKMVADGIYSPSRFQGNLPTELIMGKLATLFGPIGPNSFSFASSVLALSSLIYIFYKIGYDWKRVLLVIVVIAMNPYWVYVSTTSSDYMHPIPLFLLGLVLLRHNLPVLAALCLAVAAGDRISYTPMGLTALLWAWAIEGEKERRLVIVQSMAVFALVVCLIYVPVFISSHLSFSFFSSARPTFQGFPGLVARWLYKSLYLFGVAGTIALAVLAFNALIKGRGESQGPIGERTLTIACVVLIVYHFALFLYIPARIEYLLPALVAIAALCLNRKVSSAMLVVLALTEVSYWFVKIDLLTIAHKYDDPCDPIIALDAKIDPHFSQGVLLPGLMHETDEVSCLARVLMAMPKNIHDPLP